MKAFRLAAVLACLGSSAFAEGQNIAELEQIGISHTADIEQTANFGSINTTIIHQDGTGQHASTRNH
jgi:hypothetical protein